MFLDGLDELDQQIVKLLIRNARMSYSEIGQKIGISRVAVRSRVQALEQAGIIEEYTTVINPQKILSLIHICRLFHCSSARGQHVPL